MPLFGTPSIKTLYGHVALRPELLGVIASEQRKTSAEITTDELAILPRKIWTTPPKEETTVMSETYTILISDNGYVIYPANSDGNVSGSRIAADGALEEELKAFRVARKLMQETQQKFLASQPKTAPPAMSKDAGKIASQAEIYKAMAEMQKVSWPFDRNEMFKDMVKLVEEDIKIPRVKTTMRSDVRKNLPYFNPSKT